MTDRIDDGDAAFPIPGMITPNGDVIHPWNGMSLRDYFAVAALQGMSASSFIMTRIFENTEGVPEKVAEILALAAYKQADAMLKQRQP